MRTLTVLALLLPMPAMAQDNPKKPVAVVVEDPGKKKAVIVTIQDSINVNVTINYHSTQSQEAGASIFRDVASPGQLQAINSDLLKKAASKGCECEGDCKCAPPCTCKDGTATPAAKGNVTIKRRARSVSGDPGWLYSSPPRFCNGQVTRTHWFVRD